MRASPYARLLLLTALAACAPPTAPPPPHVAKVVVLPPHNATGDGLLVEGTSLLEKYALKSSRVTVPDVLGARLREELRHRGIEVARDDMVDAATGGRTPGSPEAAAQLVRNGKLEGDALYVDLLRWESDGSTHPAYVIVGLDASLVEPGTSKVVWHVHRAPEPVPTPGSVTVGSAYDIAAEKVATELAEPFGPER